MSLESKSTGDGTSDGLARPAHLERTWGDDALLIAQWFDEGEALKDCPLELSSDEEDAWDQALHWVRSLAVATTLRPA